MFLYAYVCMHACVHMYTYTYTYTGCLVITVATGNRPRRGVEQIEMNNIVLYHLSTFASLTFSPALQVLPMFLNLRFV